MENKTPESRPEIYARCMRCRKQVEMPNPHKVKTKRGYRYADKCGECGTNTSRICPKSDY